MAKWPLMRLERAILRTGLWRRLGTQEASHTVRYICHLLPSVEPDPWFQERVWALRLPPGRKAGHQLVGLAERGKTQTASAMAVAFGILHPEATRQTVSGPFKEAGDMQLWGGICSAYYEALDKWGAGYLQELGVTMKNEHGEERRAIWRGAFGWHHQTVAMDEVGKVQG